MEVFLQQDGGQMRVTEGFQRHNMTCSMSVAVAEVLRRDAPRSYACAACFSSTELGDRRNKPSSCRPIQTSAGKHIHERPRVSPVERRYCIQSFTTRGRPPFSPSKPMSSSSGTPKRSDRVTTGRLICLSCLRFSLHKIEQPRPQLEMKL